MDITGCFKVRPARWGDYGALVALLDGYRADEVTSLLKRGQDSAEAGSGGVYMLDAVGRRGVATGSLLPWGRQAEISSVAVLPGYRRQGCGRALLSHLIGEATRARYPSVELTCALDNLPALRLYTGMGFRVERTIVLGGAPHVVMRLSL